MQANEAIKMNIYLYFEFTVFFFLSLKKHLI